MPMGRHAPQTDLPAANNSAAGPRGTLAGKKLRRSLLADLDAVGRRDDADVYHAHEEAVVHDALQR